MTLRLMKLIAGSAFVIALAACGGGGGGSDPGPSGPSGSPGSTESSEWGSMEWDKDAWG